VPLTELIQQTPGAHPIASIDNLRNGTFESDQKLDEFLAFVTSRGARTLPEPRRSSTRTSPRGCFEADFPPGWRPGWRT
jgi:hypothetical protein